jgi:hypothetical protein
MMIQPPSIGFVSQKTLNQTEDAVVSSSGCSIDGTAFWAVYFAPSENQWA